MSVVSLAPLVASLIGAALSGGCGDDSPGRHAVSGSVKVDGAPLASGNISFQNFFATIYQVLGVDPNRLYQTPLGRPVQIVSNGQPISELL